MNENTAAWLGPRHGALVVDSAPYTSPGAHEIVVRNHAVAVNPLEWIIQLVGNVVYPWIRSPFVIGSDLAGEVVEVGSAVTRFAVGDRVLAHADGTDKDTNSAARGAFQHYTVVRAGLAAAIPDSVSYTDASVLPLGLSTAACGLFQTGMLGLRHPSASPEPTGQTVLVWGGTTSVGSNAIQLAVAAGYEVVTTASPRNFDYVRSLGASAVFDYRSPTVVAEVIAELAGRRLAGTLAVGKGAGEACARIVHASSGSRFIALTSTPASFERVAESRRHLPGVMLRIGLSTVAMRLRMRRLGVRSAFVWGSSLKNDEVGPLIYERFLPQALADGRYRAAPEPLVVGHGLEALQSALDLQRAGVSARKVVVTL